MLYVVINTCAMQDEPGHTWSRVPVQARQYALRNFIIPRYVRVLGGGIGRLVVVGDWEEGPYLYIPVKSKHFNWNDALEQRQLAWDMLDNRTVWQNDDWLLFQHDDHFVDIENFLCSDPNLESYEVVVPSRWTRLRSPWSESLDNGSVDGYIMGHAAYFRPEVMYDAPWKKIPPTRRTWDVEHTNMIKAHNYRIIWSHEHECWDVEMGAKPWQ